MAARLRPIRNSRLPIASRAISPCCPTSRRTCRSRLRRCARRAGWLRTQLRANGPTSNEADAILNERGIPVLPDILTNAGGVTVSYFEWVQDLGRLFWTRDEIRARLAEKLNDAFDRVWALAAEKEIPLRSAALVAAVREVAGALVARGIFP